MVCDRWPRVKDLTLADVEKYVQPVTGAASVANHFSSIYIQDAHVQEGGHEINCESAD